MYSLFLSPAHSTYHPPLLSILPHIFHSSSNFLICTLCMHTHTPLCFSPTHTHTHTQLLLSQSIFPHTQPPSQSHTYLLSCELGPSYLGISSYMDTHTQPPLPPSLFTQHPPPFLPPHSSPLHTAFLLNEEADIERRVVCCRGDVDKQTTGASRETGDRDGEGCRVG